MILVANPKAQYLHYKSEIDAAISRVLEKGRYILGDEVTLFEKEFAAYIGVASAIGVGSGTEALHVALKACGVGSGDEVLTVSHTAVATVSAIELCGAVPVFVDIDPASYTMDVSKVESLMSPRLKAVIPVHLYGQTVNLRPLLDIARKHHLKVIEDVAQAHGAMYEGRRAGSWGDIACFSFYPTKNLGALGDGGAVVTNDPALAERVRLLREYGWVNRYVSQISGWNTRLDELQAAVLRVKLKHLDQDNTRREELAAQYKGSLSKAALRLPEGRERSTHVYHLFVVRTPLRDALKKHLEDQGVQALIHYPTPIHLQPAYQGHCRGENQLPETERASKEILSLPMYPELTAADIQSVIAAIQSFKK